jgi:two-component system response regulator YcbB
VQPYRILLIDDDPAVVRMLQRIVEEQGQGVVVGRAADGPAGEAMALQLGPDIILIDLLMPGQDGLETIRRLRDKGYGGLFVMISQVAEKELVAQAYKAGVEFFIHKPPNRTEILAVLQRITEGLQMRRTIEQIRSSLPPLAAPAEAPAPRTGHVEAQIRRAGRRCLADLGILGEAGAADLLTLALLPPFREGAPSFDLVAVYTALSDHYQGQAADGKAPGRAAIEQRIRRAAQAALSHLAALGLEDYADPRFERLAPIFFDFNEMRSEMNRLRTGSGAPGRINLKKFIDAFLHEIDSLRKEEE